MSKGEEGQEDHLGWALGRRGLLRKERAGSGLGWEWHFNALLPSVVP